MVDLKASTLPRNPAAKASSAITASTSVRPPAPAFEPMAACVSNAVTTTSNATPVAALELEFEFEFEFEFNARAIAVAAVLIDRAASILRLAVAVAVDTAATRTFVMEI